MARIHAAIAAGALSVALAAATGAEWRSQRENARARFWFDGATFHVAGREAFGASITPEEQQDIEALARAEVARAFAGLRLSITDQPSAAYQVRVVQDFPPRTGPQRLSAAESLALGPLGSHGWVSFQAVASLALSHTPPPAGRQGVISAIGRGIGRVAVHEFAHQILTSADLHATRDRASYEYASADRPEQFHGPMHWDLAAPLLVRKLSAD